MTDSELIRLLRSIDGHNKRIIQIIDRIEESGREDCAEALREHCAQFASAEDVGGHFLVKRKRDSR